MAYFLNVFSPATYDAFRKTDQTVSGHNLRHQRAASRVLPGDKLICYMTKLSRWVGVLDVIDGPYEDATPLYTHHAVPYTLRFHVRAAVCLPAELGIPIHAPLVWNRLSYTRDLAKGQSQWTAIHRGSLVRLSDDDGAFLVEALGAQLASPTPYPIDEGEYRKLIEFTTVRTPGGDVQVIVAQPDTVETEAIPAADAVRESIRVQALLAEIGVRMGMKIWIPRADRAAVLAELGGDHAAVLDRLPLNYDDVTLSTIEQIDMLWLKGRSMKRAFEVEHTTSVYSGILRMADLLALQPNMDIRLHLVAPLSRREKVFRELLRPVFSLLDRGPLSGSCTYLSYDSVRQLAKLSHLEHLADTVLDDYVEEAGA